MVSSRSRWRLQFGLRTILMAMVLVGPVVCASGPVSQWIGSLFREDERSNAMQDPHVTLYNGGDFFITSDR